MALAGLRRIWTLQKDRDENISSSVGCCELTGFQGVDLLNGWLLQYLSIFTVFAIIR